MGFLPRSRTAQLIFQSVYCALALVAIVGSVGTYDRKFTVDFYIYFTNVSNYLGAGIMLAELIQTAKKRANDYVRTAPRLHFIGMLGLLLTLIVFNTMIANDPMRDPALNYNIECILCHVVLPILFAADWLIFYEHGKVNWKLPLLSALLPLAYLAYVFIHAALWKFDSSVMNYAGTDPIIYPYFFLNPERVGIGGIILWVSALLAAFVVGGYVFMLIDWLPGKLKRKNS